MNIENSIYQQFYKLTGGLNIPVWAHDPLEKMPDGWGTAPIISSSTTFIHVRDIVGTQHPIYGNSKTWLIFFHHLKLSVESQQFYSKYFSLYPEVSFRDSHPRVLACNGKYWILVGNRRICLAKITGMEVIPVVVEQRSI